ncbi:hypothetical protein BC828DRAFT_407942 [Blastocladiella britannica]|nr:hypothetical protein BC828DRAFT_407942 [Blastocladiella britannica]
MRVVLARKRVKPCKQDLDYIFAELDWQVEHQPWAAGPDNVAGIDDALTEDQRLRLIELVRSGPEQCIEDNGCSRERDLLDPSLFPLKYQHSRVVGESLAARSVAESMARMGLDIGHPIDPSDGEYASKEFQWLPAEIAVSEDGSLAEWTSYINSLHPETHAELYEVLAELFAACVPLLERVLARLASPVQPRIQTDASVWYKCRADPNKPTDPHDARVNYTSDFKEDADVNDIFDTDSDNTDSDCDDYDENSLSRRYNDARAYHPYAPKSFDPAKLALPATPWPELILKGRRSQVITKITTIHLTPENPKYAGGPWHMDGMANENILATAVYAYDVDNVTDPKLEFRARVKAPEFEWDDIFGVDSIYGLHGDYGPLSQPRGRISTRCGRAIAFPNLYLHKELPFRLADPTRSGYRKAVVYCLVDPRNRIPSTTQVAPQSADWLAHAVLCGPRRAERFVGCAFPIEIVRRILVLVPHMTTMVEAEEDRLKYMGEREALLDKMASIDFTGSLSVHYPEPEVSDD